MCPAIFADLSVTTNGFAYVAVPPWFSTGQLVLRPGTAATITLDYTSFDNNLTQLYSEPHGPFGDFTHIIYRYPIGIVASSGESGISIAPQDVTFPSIHEMIVTLKASAAASAPQGTYVLGFPPPVPSTITW
jgi:hypothetical protein